MTSIRQSYRRNAIVSFTGSLLLLTGLSACGQIGQLYLPEESPSTPAAESAQEEQESTDDS